MNPSIFGWLSHHFYDFVIIRPRKAPREIDLLDLVPKGSLMIRAAILN